MSQAGEIDIIGNHPEIATQYDANSGSAVPVLNTLNILGSYVLAGSIPVQTVGSGNSITTQVQLSQAIAATDVTKVGLSAFNSSEFTVDANGFVSLVGSAVTTSFNVDAHTAPGTDPVIPDGSGLVTVTGAQVAAGVVGTNVIRTDSLAANTFTIEIQRSAATGVSTIASNGVSHFNSAQFTVDANGFVSASGTGLGQTITGNSGGALSPTAGNWNILGATVAAGTSPLVTAGAGSTLTINAQRTQAIAASDATKVGLANFNSAQFTVDANGFVSASGTGVMTTLTGNSGVATPVANNINVITANSTVKFVGSGSTLTEDFGLTNLIMGSASAGITSGARNVAVGLTNLNPLTSGTDNTAIGYNALKSSTSASLNTAVGSLSQQNITTGAGANTSIGYSSLSQCTSGTGNSALGYSALTALTQGSDNCAVGSSLGNITTGTNNIGVGPTGFSGGTLTLSDSHNIMIGNPGVAGDNHKIKIGVQGSGTGQQNFCQIAGIVGVTVSNTQLVTIDSTTGQLGVTAVPVTGVSSVSGTTNRITASPTTGAVVVDISASYVGQSSITTLGTITTGVWNGTNVDLAHGGTNASLTASNGGIFYSTGTAGAILAGTATASKMLLSGATAAPTWSTSTIPSSSGATANKVLLSDGTNYVLSTPTFPNASATSGKIIQSDGTNWVASTPTYPATAGSSGKILISDGTNIVSSTPTYPNSATGTGTILRADGTNWVATTATYPATTTSQQILYSTADNVVGQLTTANSKFPATNSSGTLAMRGLSVVSQVFTSNGTYTPTSGMLYCVVEAVGGGGASGGVATTSGTTSGYAGGGGGGEYARGVFSAATIGASQAVTIGNGGTAGTAGNNPGNTGSTTSLGALITAIGGGGGAGSAAAATGSGVSNLGGVGGTGGTGGDFRVAGQPGGNGIASFGLFGTSGAGGTSLLSGGARGLVASAVGDTGQLYGGGGSGSVGFNVAARAGAPGGKGIIVITEYVIA